MVEETLDKYVLFLIFLHEYSPIIFTNKEKLLELTSDYVLQRKYTVIVLKYYILCLLLLFGLVL